MSRSSAAGSSSNNYNICLICGSHTNLVLNIFEPRCGPNIVDIIFAKFKFKAEKNSSDKFICYDCNNWLINWFSLQNVNETTENTSEGEEGRRNGDKQNNSGNVSRENSTNKNVLKNHNIIIEDPINEIEKKKYYENIFLEKQRQIYFDTFIQNQKKLYSVVPEFNKDIFPNNVITTQYSGNGSRRLEVSSRKHKRIFKKNKVKGKRKVMSKAAIAVNRCSLCKFSSIHYQILRKYRRNLILKNANNKSKIKYTKMVSPSFKSISSSPSASKLTKKVSTELKTKKRSLNINFCASHIDTDYNNCGDVLLKDESSIQQHHLGEPTSSININNLDDKICQMLQNQGTSLVYENQKTEFDKINNQTNTTIKNEYNNEIILNFNRAISEVIQVNDDKVSLKVNKKSNLVNKDQNHIPKPLIKSRKTNQYLRLNPFWQPTNDFAIKINND